MMMLCDHYFSPPIFSLPFIGLAANLLRLFDFREAWGDPHASLKSHFWMLPLLPKI
jgi:hypothetical protein